MFTPTRDEVRLFFSTTWKKHLARQVLEPMESIALDILLSHPEYHDIIEDPNAKQQDFSVENGQTNPFLHMALHLAIKEQVKIDQPIGIRAIWQELLRTHDPHDAEHRIMEALAEMIWEVQRSNKPYDGEHYLELIRRYTTQ